MSRLNRESPVPSWHLFAPSPDHCGPGCSLAIDTVENNHSKQTVGYAERPEANKKPVSNRIGRTILVPEFPVGAG